MTFKRTLEQRQMKEMLILMPEAGDDVSIKMDGLFRGKTTTIWMIQGGYVLPPMTPWKPPAVSENWC